MGLEQEIRVADMRATAAFNHVEHGALGASIGLAGKSPRQPLDEGGNGGENMSSADRAGVAHLDAVRGMELPAPRELIERLASAVIRIDQERRRALLRPAVDRQQILTIARRGTTVGM